MLQVEDNYKVYQHLSSDKKPKRLNNGEQPPKSSPKNAGKKAKDLKKEPSKEEDPQQVVTSDGTPKDQEPKKSPDPQQVVASDDTPQDQEPKKSPPQKPKIIAAEKKAENQTSPKTEKSEIEESTKPSAANEETKPKKQAKKKGAKSKTQPNGNDDEKDKPKKKTAKTKEAKTTKQKKAADPTSVKVLTTTRGCSPINITNVASIAVQTDQNHKKQQKAIETQTPCKSLQSIGTDPIQEIQQPKHDHQPIASHVIRVQTSNNSKQNDLNNMFFSNMNGAPPQTPDGPRFSQDGSQLMYTHPGVQANLVEKLHTFQTQGFVCDIIMRVDGIDFKAHKIVLAASSPYFAELFRNVNTIRTDKLILEGLQPQSVAAMLGYFYLAKLIIDEEDVEDLLDAAHYFKVCVKIFVIHFLPLP